MKTKAPSSMKRFAAARPMPVAPPVMTATLPSSFAMTFLFGFCLWSFGEVPKNPEIGPPESGVECGDAHIGGAKSIRLDERRQLRRSMSAVRNWVALADLSYNHRTYCCTTR